MRMKKNRNFGSAEVTRIRKNSNKFTFGEFFHDSAIFMRAYMAFAAQKFGSSLIYS